jgi:hypothetical protein
MRQVVRCLPSDSRLYRYWLEVQLAESRLKLAVILKNPSTASAGRSDPTMGKVEAWALRRGFGSVVVVNLFALRATEPAILNQHSYARAVGPKNDAYIRKAVDTAGVVVAAWGNPNGVERGRYDRRIAEVLQIVDTRRLKVVEPLTQLGYPRHGLHWNGVAVIKHYDELREGTNSLLP